VIGRRERFFRFHRRDHSPWWFSDDGSGRFDLAEGRGTCYLAATKIGACIEVFRTNRAVPESAIEARYLSILSVPKRSKLADCTVSRARRFGITGAIHSQPEYDLTHAWAQAFAEAGFDGIWYRLGHDPAQSELGIALFGPAGEGNLTVRASDPIDQDVIEEARRRFGLIVATTPA
jgi:hypothetical protein